MAQMHFQRATILALPLDTSIEADSVIDDNIASDSEPMININKLYIITACMKRESVYSPPVL